MATVPDAAGTRTGAPSCFCCNRIVLHAYIYTCAHTYTDDTDHPDARLLGSLRRRAGCVLPDRAPHLRPADLVSAAR
jgi:hypothetical protein